MLFQVQTFARFTFNNQYERPQRSSRFRISHRLGQNNHLVRSQVQLRPQRLIIHRGSGYCGKTFRGAEKVGVLGNIADIDIGEPLLETAVEKCGGVMCVTGRSKTAAPSITMKDVRRYGKLE